MVENEASMSTPELIELVLDLKKKVKEMEIKMNQYMSLELSDPARRALENLKISKHIPFHPEGTSKEKVSFVNSFLANDSNEAWMMINIIDHCNLRWELSKSGKNLTIGKLLKKLIGPEMIQEFEWPSDRNSAPVLPAKLVSFVRAVIKALHEKDHITPNWPKIEESLQKKLINWKFRKIQKNKEEEDDEDGQMPKKAKKKPRKIVKSKEKEKADLMGKKEQDLEKIAENLAIDKNMPKQNIVQELTKERSTQDLHDSTCMSCFKVFDKEIDLRAHVVGVHHATYERYLEQKARKNNDASGKAKKKMTKKEQRTRNKKQEEEPGDLKKSANTNLPEATQELTKKQEGNKAKKKKTSQGDLACFNIDDTIMAKMKSSSTWDAAWPARIETKKDKGYNVFFFGFGSRSFIRPGNIRPYLDHKSNKKRKTSKTAEMAFVEAEEHFRVTSLNRKRAGMEEVTADQATAKRRKT